MRTSLPIENCPEMADTPSQKRVLPARERRESAAKRRATSPPKVSTPVAPSPSSTPQPQIEVRVKRKYTKRASLVHVSTPTRSASAATSNQDELLPTRMTSSRPLPVISEAQPESSSLQQYQSIAESAILAASLHRSRMQWLCNGIFKRYWTKPVKRKGTIEQPPNNPDVKSMQKLGNVTITVEPHTFDVTLYVVREPQAPSTPIYKHPNQSAFKNIPVPPVSAPPLQSSVHPPAVSNVDNPAPSPTFKASPVPAQTDAKLSSPTPQTVRPASPPGPTTKTTDPVIQMLASRAATDNNLKELMKVVATSRATPDQLKEFQAHIDEINGIVKKQDAEKPKAKKKPIKIGAPIQMPPQPVAAHPAAYNSVHRNSPLGPGPTQAPQFSAYPVQPRAEAVIKHIVIEFTSAATGQAMTPDRWLFPENAVLDLVYGGTEMTCSFFVERKGSDVLATMKDLTSEEMQNMTGKWQADTDYYQPVTMIVRATQHRTIESIARNAKPLVDVQKYMEEVMQAKSRAPNEYLVLQLPRDRPEDFVDSAVEMSAEEDEQLKEFYPM